MEEGESCEGSRETYFLAQGNKLQTYVQDTPNVYIAIEVVCVVFRYPQLGPRPSVAGFVVAACDFIAAVGFRYLRPRF